MKNRFESNRSGGFFRILRILSLLLFLIIFGSFLMGIQSISDTTLEKQQESLETALSRSIAQCYAVEGIYPPNITYLEEHYGLVYDEELFFIDYQPIGSNIAPEVTVLPRLAK